MISQPIDIADMTRDLVATLRRDGLNGIRFTDIQPECEEEWGPGYAIVANAYSPDIDSDHDYFDHDRLLADFREFFRDAFTPDSTVEVLFHNLEHGSNEIEVIRTGS